MEVMLSPEATIRLTSITLITVITGPGGRMAITGREGVTGRGAAG